MFLDKGAGFLLYETFLFEFQLYASLGFEGQRGWREFPGGVLCCTSDSDSHPDKLGTVTAVIPWVFLQWVRKLCMFWWKVNTSRSTVPCCTNHLPYRCFFLRAGRQDYSGEGLAVTDMTVMGGWALWINNLCLYTSPACDGFWLQSLWGFELRCKLPTNWRNKQIINPFFN